LHELKFSFTNSALLIRNLPVTNYDLTPDSCSAIPIKSNYLTEAAITLFAAQIGYIFGYAQERNGQVIQNVVPEKDRQDINSSEGSSVPLALHIDNGYLDCPPDFVLLFCLKADVNNESCTHIISAKEIINNLNDEDITALMAPDFSIQFSHSFIRGPADPLWSKPRPIITGTKEEPEIRVKFGTTRGVNAKAQLALEKLVVLCQSGELGQDVFLKSGDILIPAFN
jgi:L-asparagine oxygenase